MSGETWKSCHSCHKPIQYGQKYFACSVSTCNRKRFTLAFCTLDCWDAHVPVMNHRNAWAEEKRAPRAPEPEQPQQASRRRIVKPGRAAPRGGEDLDILIVASKLKKYVKEQADMNTSADVLEALSHIVRDKADEAIRRARADGRKTVKGRDFH